MAGQTAHLRQECAHFVEAISAIHFRFIASLKLPFKFYPEDRAARTTSFGRRRRPAGAWGEQVGEKKGGSMTSMEMASGGAEPANADDCFGLGMVYSSGAGVAVDLVQAHKWFNIAAMRGHRQAAQLRREVAEQMSDSEIGLAQRAARDWLKAHPEAPASARIRAAA
jgi:hypothetical protein